MHALTENNRLHGYQSEAELREIIREFPRPNMEVPIDALTMDKIIQWLHQDDEFDIIPSSMNDPQTGKNFWKTYEPMPSGSNAGIGKAGISKKNLP